MENGMNIKKVGKWMKACAVSFVVVTAIIWVPGSYARNTIQSHSVDEVLSSADGKAKLGDSIKFAFGKTSIGSVAKNHGEFHTNKKTNAFGKSDEKACKWAFLSAMITLRDRAVAEGGNAVINIRSNYKSTVTSSETTFQCGAGAIMAGVALIGDVVTLD